MDNAHLNCDYTEAEDMTEFVVNATALDDLDELPNAIWKQNVEDLLKKDSQFTGLTQQQVCSRVYVDRKENTSGDGMRKSDAELLGNKKDSWLCASISFVVCSFLETYDFLDVQHVGQVLTQTGRHHH